MTDKHVGMTDEEERTHNDTNHPFVVQALYHSAKIVANLKDENFSLVLFRNDNANNGEKAIQRAMQSFQAYYHYQVPEADVEREMPGFIGFWMPTAMQTQDGKQFRPQEILYLEKLEEAQKVEFVRDAENLQDLSQRVQVAACNVRRGEVRSN